ncbi:MAG TPA: protein-glutamate O-methyltransferase CheR [Steroidobacteraceae bacterium]
MTPAVAVRTIDVMEPLPSLSDREFAQFQRFIYDSAGIALTEAKKLLVTGRLAARLRHYGMDSYGEYFRLLAGGQHPEEVQMAIDLLTTNETYFFREPNHFDFLRAQLQKLVRYAEPVRIWSAAGSTGEEAYSIAMCLEDCLCGRPWSVLASDISVRVLAKARAGHYPMERARNIPLPYLQRFCLRGQGKQENTLLVERGLRNKVQFQQVNLNASLPPLGLFDFVFLRNVLIYFNQETKREVVGRVLRQLRPGGWLLISHTESLYDVGVDVDQIAPSIFRKP